MDEKSGGTPLKPVIWIGSSRHDLREFPDDVQDAVGYALYVAQRGGKAAEAKPLRGYGGAGVLELVEDDDDDTYRAVYTVRFAEAIYVLHCFQKKSTRGVATSHRDLNLIETRLRRAEEFHEKWIRENQR
jgi:phage-related protein